MYLFGISGQFILCPVEEKPNGSLACHLYLSVGRSQDLLVCVLQAASMGDEKYECLR